MLAPLLVAIAFYRKRTTAQASQEASQAVASDRKRRNKKRPHRRPAGTSQRDTAIEAATRSALDAKIPERGSSFGHLLSSCGIHKTGDVILACIHYLRSVERESNTPPREIRRLISQTGRWTEDEVEKWNLSLYINRMIEGGTTGRGKGPLLTYPANSEEKNRFVILTDAGLDYLEDLSIGE